MQRSLKPQSTGRHRGDPPILSEECKVQNEIQFHSKLCTLNFALRTPAWLSSDSSSFVNCRGLPRESASLSAGSIFLADKRHANWNVSPRNAESF